MFGIEVVAIDLEKSIVRIRNGGTESDLTVEVPKQSGGGGPAAPSAPVGRTASVAPPATPGMGQPTIVSSSEPRGGVTMLGGGGGFAGNTGGVSSYGATATPAAPASMANMGRMGGISSYGGTPNYGGGMMAANNGIPSRPLRTTTPTKTAQVDPATQAVLIEANRMNNPQHFPPLPPTDLSPQIQGGGQGPAFPAFPGQR